MSKIKIFASDGFSKEGVAILEENGFEIIVQKNTPREELLSVIKDYDALIIRSASTADEEVFKQTDKLKLVARAGVGLDNVDIKAATERGIVVMNAPGGNTMSTAELSFAMLMSLARKIPQAYASMKEGKWEKKLFTGVEIHGKTLGIIGLGRIGREVVKRALAFGMNVLGYDPYFSDEQAEKIGIKNADLETIITQSDFITVHTPLTKDTENMLTLKEMKKMKKSVRLINCARGGIINEEDLKTALKEEIIAGAALDVYTKEPLEDYSLLESGNCVTTPHLGASTGEAQVSVAIETANALVSYFKQGIPQNSVNFPTIDVHAYEEIKDFVSLASKMGYLLSQVSGNAVSEVKVSFSGSLLKKPTKMITVAALKGLLSGMSEEDVNFVNAPTIATGRGISVVERTVDKVSEYSDILAVKIETDKGSFDTWGTIFSDGSLRIVKYNIYHMELKPEGILLFIQHQDRTGFIGKVGTMMGNHGVNIADMRLIREQKDAPVLTVLTLDSDPPNEVLKEIEELGDIYSVKKFSV